jgi:glycosyltransferase involved in cell wall biosynthesis
MWQFRRSLRNADRVIVQTPVMRSRLATRFAVSESSVDVVPQPVPRHVAGGAGIQGRSALGTCPKPIRLLFLASYYGHKNHDILPAVVRELRGRGMGGLVQIFTTLGDDAPASLRERLAHCPDVITDLGRLAPAWVADALADASALFLPTLVESYGLIYLEAMACGRPTLTSDRDFARWMCGDTALYFDPMDAASIVQAIASLPEFARRPDLPTRFRARLLGFPPDWRAVAERFAEALRAPGDATRRREEAEVTRSIS